MITVSSLHALHEKTGPRDVVIACGVFDGVHRGHQKLLDTLARLAEKHAALPIALTFKPHPLTVLELDAPPPRLTSHPQKVELLHSYGAEAVVVLDFNRKLADLPAPEFLQSYLLSSDITLKGIVVGQNWRFGAGGHGDLTFLKEAGQKHGFEVAGVPEYEIAGAPVSSTRIRQAISRGDLEAAQQMLGRPYAIRGRVIRGKGIAGPQLERATANLDPDGLLLPPPGVYAASGRRIDDQQDDAASAPVASQAAILYVGSAPTLQDGRKEQKTRVEVHFLDLQKDFYGCRIEVHFLAFIREERRFKSVSELKKQIDADIRVARQTGKH